MTTCVLAVAGGTTAAGASPNHPRAASSRKRRPRRASTGWLCFAEAVAVAGRTGERFYEAALYRPNGELTLQKFGVTNPQPLTPNSHAEAEAEACFQKAIETARQQATSLELRAVMSLGCLWQYQGKQAETRQLLSEIYGWFTLSGHAAPADWGSERMKRKREEPRDFLDCTPLDHLQHHLFDVLSHERAKGPQRSVFGDRLNCERFRAVHSFLAHRSGNPSYG